MAQLHRTLINNSKKEANSCFLKSRQSWSDPTDELCMSGKDFTDWTSITEWLSSFLMAEVNAWVSEMTINARQFLESKHNVPRSMISPQFSVPKWYVNCENCQSSLVCLWQRSRILWWANRQVKPLHVTRKTAATLWFVHNPAALLVETERQLIVIFLLSFFFAGCWCHQRWGLKWAQCATPHP